MEINIIKKSQQFGWLHDSIVFNSFHSVHSHYKIIAISFRQFLSLCVLYVSVTSLMHDIILDFYLYYIFLIYYLVI